MTAGRLTPQARSLRQEGGFACIPPRLAIEAPGWTIVRFTDERALIEPRHIDDAIRARAKALGL